MPLKGDRVHNDNEVTHPIVTGFNTNISYQGEVYHVQTEDEGTDYPVITTFLFKGGEALLSRKTSYLSAGNRSLEEDLSASGVLTPCQDRIKEWMKEQHKRILKELVAGKIPLQGKSAAKGTV